MFIYRNNSHTTKTFHGVTFKPGDTKECPGYINNKYFVRMKSMPQELPKAVEKSRKSISKKVHDDDIKENVVDDVEDIESNEHILDNGLDKKE